MKLFYDRRDLPNAAKLNDRRLHWLQELGATELAEALPDDRGFLFGYEMGVEHLEQQVGRHPGIHDRPDERGELICLDDILHQLDQRGANVPTPKTWLWLIDQDPPADLQFPLFVRTPKSSWKRGGGQSKVNNLRELQDEAELLRRVFGWDTPLVLRQWLDLAVAGKWMFGDAPQEVRVWIVDAVPVAWSFHYLHAVSHPAGFPPASEALSLIQQMAAEIGRAFRSRLIAADFVRDTAGDWHFLEAGPGAAAGNAHERVFKFVAQRLVGQPGELADDRVGGRL